jgi:hypothetical protein
MENVMKLTEQELQQIKDIQQQQETLIGNFGQLEYQIQLLELQKEKLVEQLESTRNKETEIANQLSEKYGNGTINIEEGTFTKQS